MNRPPSGGPPFLLDTHVWFWYLAGSTWLPAGIRKAIDEAPGDVWLCPISIWEVGMLHERGRVRLSGGLRAWLEEAIGVFPVQEASLNREIALISREIDLPHRDPADHFIAATALVYGQTLLTVDERLGSAAWLPTRSE